MVTMNVVAYSSILECVKAWKKAHSHFLKKELKRNNSL
jgi:hypothetical protein